MRSKALTSILAWVCGTLILVTHSQSFGQSTFIKTFGSTGEDGGSCIIETPDGNFVMAGLANDLPYPKINLLVKFDGNGDTVWTKTVNYVLDEKAYNLKNTADGGILMTGEGKYCVNGNCGTDGYLVKMDSDGEVLWSKGYGSTYWDDITDAEELADGSWILSGETVSIGAGSYDMFIMKVSATGDTLWHRAFGGVGQDYCTSVMVCSDGNFLLTGAWRDTAQFMPSEPILIKVDQNGNILWAKEYELGTYVTIMDADEVSDGYVLMTLTGMMKVDKQGNFQWGYTYPGFRTYVNPDFYCKMNKASDGNYLLAGKYTDATGTDAVIIKADPNGTILWAKTYGELATIDVATEVIEVTGGRLLASGTTYSYGNGDADAMVLMMDSNGDIGTCGSSASITPTTISPNVLTVSPSVATGLWTAAAGFGTHRPAVPFTDPCQSLVTRGNDLGSNGIELWYSDGVMFVRDVAIAVSNMQITDVQGRVIEVAEVSAENSLNLAPGIYIARYSSESGTVVRKFLVN